SGCDPPLAVLGDLVSAAGPHRHSPEAIDALLAAVARARPAVWARFGVLLTDLLREDVFLSDAWSPDEAHARDGFAFGPARDLADQTRPPWNALSGSRLLQQVVVLVRADTAAWKAVENDYTGYPGHVGAAYDEIRPLAGSYLRGTDSAGKPFASVQIFFRCDLPFPFTSYGCHLRILNRLDGADRLVTDVYSTSDDFHWMAGRDVIQPVRDAAGEPVGLLLVRQFGFDLDNVPDDDDDRRAAIRGSLGNLKRRAERALAAQPVEGEPVGAEEAPGTDPEQAIAPAGMPAFEVRGLRS
ncbi:MAG: hypothetical protein ACYTG2_17930, partial [Planctomycetota bacterium]